jgi:hypothetical protein
MLALSHSLAHSRLCLPARILCVKHCRRYDILQLYFSGHSKASLTYNRYATQQILGILPCHDAFDAPNENLGGMIRGKPLSVLRLIMIHVFDSGVNRKVRINALFMRC